MVYSSQVGVIVPQIQKFKKQLIFAVAAILMVSFAAMTLSASAAPKTASGPGKVSIGVDATTWESNTPSGPGLIPIGGSGQVNGEFTIAERNGIQLGIRAQQRFLGTLEATSNSNGKVGVYNAEAGTSYAQDRATWNYDWHVDLRNARGVAAGKTLGDYTLSLETDIADTTLFGRPVPLDLTFGFVPGDTVLYQSSQNPKFGNAPFDADAAGIYNFRLVLTPVTFNGPPIAVSMVVNVVEAE